MSGPERHGRRSVILRLGAIGAAGGGLGCALVLAAPASAFERAVPWLIGAASLAVLVRPRAAGLWERRRWLTDGAVFVVGVYGGYFGAAAGVVMLALLSQRFPELPVASAVKNVVLGIANAVAAVVFAVAAPVHWESAALLALGLLVGGSLGPAIVRRVNPTVLRSAIALAGLGLAITLGLRA